MPEHANPSWTNWSGSVRYVPARLACPEDEAELAELIGDAFREGRQVRPLGAGHSSSPIIATDDTIVSLRAFRGLLGADARAQEATVGAGTTLEEAGRLLFECGLAVHNLGDINKQSVAGAFMTGTHGTGRRLRNLASMLVGARLVDGQGRPREVSIEREPELIAALRVSLGALGIITSLRLRLLPAYRLRRRDWCADTDDCLAHLDALVETNRQMDFYWYPRRDEVKIRTLNEIAREPVELPFARLIAEEEGWSHEIVARKRELRFEEMEYALPAAAGPECFQAIRSRMKERHRAMVGWRVLYRTVAADDAMLSTAHGRDTVTISLHQNASLPYWPLFTDIEPIFRAFDGRPHWGKKHTLSARELSGLYPRWDDFQRIRQELDPAGVFLSPGLRTLLQPA